MVWILAGLAAVLVVVIGLLAVGRETSLLVATARPAVFDLEEALQFIADRLPEDVAGRLTHDDVRWVLRTDVDLLESATAEVMPDYGPEIVDEDTAVALILARADADDRDIGDGDVVAVLAGRLEYLEAIGAIGPVVAGPDDPTGVPT